MQYINKTVSFNYNTYNIQTLKQVIKAKNLNKTLDANKL